jgi:molybdopterin-biosynthesis enzyme MoeA-like protein
VKNSVSGAPGFQMGNVFVLAGVPGIMRAMLEDAVPKLKTGTPMTSCTIAAPLREGAFALQLGEIQKLHPNVSIGSYPAFGEGKVRSSLVVRGRDAAQVEAAAREIEAMLCALGAKPQRLD